MADLAHHPWIALATGAPSVLLTSVDGARLRVVDDREEFGSLLFASRPRLAIVTVPPASDADEALVLRERRRRPSLRIVHLSGTDDIERRLEALRRGFDEAFAISMDPAELLTRLEILGDHAHRRPVAEVPVAHGVVMDPIAHEVHRDGARIHLRPKEYQLLAMLAANPGRVYTRRQLLDRVWGHDHDGGSRTVDVHVRWLRSKIEIAPSAPVHLITVRGVGYRLDPPSS
jgi:two-component system response regulator RegX3